MATESISAQRAASSRLKELFLDQLQELYWAEKKLVKVLAKMAKACTTEELKQAFQHHLEQTSGQIIRLDGVFNSMGETPQKAKSPTMGGVLKELHRVLDNEEGALQEVALIVVLQKAKHFEIASYGALKELATTMGLSAACDLLEQTLQEEKQTDTLLSLIAEGGVNQQASEEPLKATQ